MKPKDIRFHVLRPQRSDPITIFFSMNKQDKASRMSRSRKHNWIRGMNQNENGQ